MKKLFIFVVCSVLFNLHGALSEKLKSDDDQTLEFYLANYKPFAKKPYFSGLNAFCEKSPIHGQLFANYLLERNWLLTKRPQENKQFCKKYATEGISQFFQDAVCKKYTHVARALYCEMNSASGGSICKENFDGIALVREVLKGAYDDTWVEVVPAVVPAVQEYIDACDICNPAKLNELTEDTALSTLALDILHRRELILSKRLMPTLQKPLCDVIFGCAGDEKYHPLARLLLKMISPQEQQRLEKIVSMNLCTQATPSQSSIARRVFCTLYLPL